MKQFDEIEDLYRNEFADFQEMPPASVKSSIDEVLFASGKNRGMNYWYYGGGILMIIFLLLLSGNESAVSQDQFLSHSNVHHEIGKQNKKEAVKTKSNDSEPFKIVKNEDAQFESELNKAHNPKRTAVNKERANASMAFIEEPENNAIIEIAEVSSKGTEIVSKSDSSSTDEKTTLTEGPEENELPILDQPYKRTSFLSIYGGIGEFSSRIKNTDTASIAREMEMNFGIEYGRRMNERWSLVSGVNYTGYREMFQRHYQDLDTSVITGYEQVISYDSVNQVNDTTYLPMYLEFENNESFTYRVNSFSIPIAFKYTLNNESKFDYGVYGGLVLNFNSVSVLESNSLAVYSTTKTFGMTAVLRLEFAYHFERMSIGAYGRFAADLIPALNYSPIRRDRLSAGGGLFLRIDL
ncbi:MAG: hypothetical protein EP305_08590 [Bacteroidetes bacterium]|nr:MAG: hypothetical protein EP305_08590 [Bacteroidota bacterium]